MKLTKKELEKVRELIENGTAIPNPSSTKDQYVRSIKEMYWEVELLRKYIIEKKI